MNVVIVRLSFLNKSEIDLHYTVSRVPIVGETLLIKTIDAERSVVVVAVEHRTDIHANDGVHAVLMVQAPPS